MRTECAVICDAATLRDGLLHILGAGVTTLTLPGLPSNLMLAFAFRVVLESREVRQTHTLRINLTDTRDGTQQGPLEAVFTRQDSAEPQSEAAIAAPVALHPFRVEHPGMYLLEATLDQHHIASIPLRVELTR